MLETDVRDPFALNDLAAEALVLGDFESAAHLLCKASIYVDTDGARRVLRERAAEAFQMALSGPQRES